MSEKENHDLCTYLFDEIEMVMNDDDFQRSFFESMHDEFINGKTLSRRQIDVLKKMYQRLTDV